MRCKMDWNRVKSVALNVEIFYRVVVLRRLCMPRSKTMSKMEIDCCTSPSLKTVKNFVSTNEKLVRIRSCAHCGTFWYCHEIAFETNSSEYYDRCKWYARLSPEEAKELTTSDRAPNLEMFRDRAGFVRDDDGMCKSNGIPAFIK